MRVKILTLDNREFGKNLHSFFRGECKNCGYSFRNIVSLLYTSLFSRSRVSGKKHVHIYNCKAVLARFIAKNLTDIRLSQQYAVYKDCFPKFANGLNILKGIVQKVHDQAVLLPKWLSNRGIVLAKDSLVTRILFVLFLLR